jgi:hypothetical protein
MFEGVDVGDVGSRGQLFEVHVIGILSVGAERGELVGRVGFTVQQEGERHKDSRLYWGSGDEQCSQESREREVSQRGFLWRFAGRHRENGEMSGSCRQGGERERRWHL